MRNRIQESGKSKGTFIVNYTKLHRLDFKGIAFNLNIDSPQSIFS